MIGTRDWFLLTFLILVGLVAVAVEGTLRLVHYITKAQNVLDEFRLANETTTEKELTMEVFGLSLSCLHWLHLWGIGQINKVKRLQWTTNLV